MIELQPYDRQPNESESAWIAFCCYQDLGQGRTLEAASVGYRAVTGGKSKRFPRHFCIWRKEHDWDARCAAFDRDRAAKVQDTLLEEDRTKYLDSVESFRKNLDNIGRTSMANVNICHALTTNSLNLLMKRQVKDTELSRADIQTMILLGKRDRDSMAIAESANKLLIEAYGLVKVIEKINAVEAED